MNPREAVQENLSPPPGEIPPHHTAEELEFIAGVQKAMEEGDHGLGIPFDQVRRGFAEWIKNFT